MLVKRHIEWQALSTLHQWLDRAATIDLAEREQLLPHTRQVTLIYHKKLDDNWQAAAEKLRTALAGAPSSSESAVSVIGRSHKQVNYF